MKKIEFIPTVYEHCAALLNITPSQAAKSDILLAKGQIAAYELYQHQIMSIGLDIYNIEAEALGMKVTYHSDNTLPSCERSIISEYKDLLALKLPNPLCDGRMPLLLSACEIVKNKVPSNVAVNGSVVGPFTLAAILRGFESFLYDIIDDEEFAAAQLAFAAEVSLSFAKAYIDRGIGITLNESWIAPPLLSPDIYRDFVFATHKDLITKIKAYGDKPTALICGGNTTPIAKKLLETGTSLIMADWTCDRKQLSLLCNDSNAMLRASISPEAVERGDAEVIRSQIQTVLSDCCECEKLVLGCGIVSYDTPPGNVIMTKEILHQTLKGM